MLFIQIFDFVFFIFVFVILIIIVIIVSGGSGEQVREGMGNGEDEGDARVGQVVVVVGGVEQAGVRRSKHLIYPIFEN